MKKITQFSIVALVLLFSIQAKAQKINLTAGYTSSTWSGVDTDDLFGEKQALAGFHAGASIDIALNDNLTFQPGLLFTTKGAEFGLDSDSITLELQYSFRYLCIPLNIKYSYEIDDDMSIFGTAGPYVGIGLTGKTKTTLEAPLLGIDDTQEMDLDWEGLNRLDFGLGFGAGVQYQAFSLGVYYDLGLTDVFGLTEGDDRITNNALRISAGYTINF
jgi:hypothetical protein